MPQSAMPVYWQQLSSLLGPIALAANAHGLTQLVLGQLPGDEGGRGAIPTLVQQHLDQARVELSAYFAGQQSSFQVALAPAGTHFQQTVWQALQTIPYGQTWSYGQLAADVGRPRACQAVGQANGANPIPIIIPCHRVIRANGDLGGYSGGLAHKKQLLNVEQSQGDQ